ncbi:Ras- protein Rab-7 [Phytophthora boehmeriae]|uniref:Ras- protein Rab-7 n=1 Tax=Phytophthora boehmeriae TaxID=109152 RepID=A0A8T1XCU2_9STRA|nr:Ras- protein Rab-7 [Phytophthora boehmeriae]
MDKIKVVLLGEAAVGKTTLFKRLMGSPLDSEYVPSTTASIGAKLVQLEGHPPVVFELWDVPPYSFAGQSIYAQYLRSTHAVVLVYSLEVPTTWRALPTYLDVARREITGDDMIDSRSLPIVMVGCKSDCVDDENEDQHEAAVTREEARAWCQDHKVKHIEVSTGGHWLSMLDIFKVILEHRT